MASMDEVIEETKARDTQKVEVEEIEEGDEDTVLQDLLDSLSLLSKSMHLLAILADPTLCKSLTKREREYMTRMAEQIRVYLESVESVYEGD